MGLLAPGSYVVAGPGKYSSSEEIDGLKVIHSPYNQVWLIARTVVKGPSDVATAHAIQAEEKLVPLKNYRTEGLAYEPPSSEAKLTTTCGQVPGTHPGESQTQVLDGPRQRPEKISPAGRGRAAARKTGGLPHRAGHAPDPGRQSAPPRSKASAKPSFRAPTRYWPMSGERSPTALPRTTAGLSVAWVTTGPTTSCAPRPTGWGRGTDAEPVHLSACADRPQRRQTERHHDPLRRPLPGRRLPDPGAGLLVADHVRIERLLRGQPARPLHAG